MAITTIYHVEHTLPDGLTDYLSANPTEFKRFEWCVIECFKGNVSSGSNSYSDRVEWAEFDSGPRALKADKEMSFIVCEWHTLAIQAGY